MINTCRFYKIGWQISPLHHGNQPSASLVFLFFSILLDVERSYRKEKKFFFQNFSKNISIMNHFNVSDVVCNLPVHTPADMHIWNFKILKKSKFNFWKKTEFSDFCWNFKITYSKEFWSVLRPREVFYTIWSIFNSWRKKNILRLITASPGQLKNENFQNFKKSQIYMNFECLYGVPGGCKYCKNGTIEKFMRK